MLFKTCNGSVSILENRDCHEGLGAKLVLTVDAHQRQVVIAHINILNATRLINSGDNILALFNNFA